MEGTGFKMEKDLFVEDARDNDRVKAKMLIASTSQLQDKVSSRTQTLKDPINQVLQLERSLEILLYKMEVANVVKTLRLIIWDGSLSNRFGTKPIGKKPIQLTTISSHETSLEHSREALRFFHTVPF